MEPNISKFLVELGYRTDQISSVLKTIKSLRKNQNPAKKKLSISDVLKNGSPIFSSYPDQITAPGKSSIKILDYFISKYFPNIPMYILPFWEATGDGGFSIKDFTKPRRQVGTLEDLRQFARKRVVCLDMVYSNISVDHEHVKNHLKIPYQLDNAMVAEFISKDPVDIPKSHRGHSAIRRFKSTNGDRWLWTTFSPHQVNLNYSSPQTLIWLLKTLAFYLDLGASLIRLDAVPFTWTKESGPVLNAPQCHSLVKIIRSFIDYYKPGTLLIAQSDYDSKPLHDYIGNENSEAHILYRHEISPILIHAVISKNKKYLNDWVSHLTEESDQNWINFLSTCDGIFLRPWKYPLPDSGIQLLVDACVFGGGVVQNYHWENHPPATLCTTTYSILHYGVDENDTVRRLILIHAMLLALPGVPALFFNSLFGMENWKKWQSLENEARSIVREKYSEKLIKKLMSNPNSVQKRLYEAIKPLVDIRIEHPAIGQCSHINIISNVPDSIVAWSLANNNKIVNCFFNISDHDQTVSVNNVRSLVGEIVDNNRIKFPPLSYSWVERL